MEKAVLCFAFNALAFRIIENEFFKMFIGPEKAKGINRYDFALHSLLLAYFRSDNLRDQTLIMAKELQAKFELTLSGTIRFVVVLLDEVFANLIDVLYSTEEKMWRDIK